MQVLTVQPCDIDANWSWIAPFVSCVENQDPGWTVDDVRAALNREEAQLWAAHDGERPVGVWITKLGKTGNTPSGLVWIASGERMEVCLDLYREHTEKWFREMGCRFAEVVGRKGWKRVLPDYEERGIVLVKRL